MVVMNSNSRNSLPLVDKIWEYFMGLYEQPTTFPCFVSQLNFILTLIAAFLLAPAPRGQKLELYLGLFITEDGHLKWFYKSNPLVIPMRET